MRTRARSFGIAVLSIGGLLLGIPGTTSAVSTSEAGAVVVYPDVEVDSAQGADTILQLSNTASEPVNARCVYDMVIRPCIGGQPGEICGPDSPGTCSGSCERSLRSREFILRLTPGQPLGWGASTGRPQLPIDGTVKLGIDGTSNMDSTLPPVPSDPFTGTLRCVTVGDDGRPAQSNVLQGVATLRQQVGGAERMGQYHAVGISSVAVGNADDTLILGGDVPEYEACPHANVLPIVFEGAVVTLGAEGLAQRTVSPSVALTSCGRAAVIEESGASVQFSIINEFAQTFSASTKLHGHLVTRLVDIDSPNQPSASVFHVATMGTLTGQLRLDSPSGTSTLAVGIETYVDPDDPSHCDMVAFNAHTFGEHYPSEHLVLPAPCLGDCDYDRTVSVDELVMSVNIALGETSAVRCTNSDANQDGMVTVEELIRSVSHALVGCQPSPAPLSPTQTPTFTMAPL